MGIYDRQYYQDEGPPQRLQSSGPKMITTKLIIVTVVLYCIDQFLFKGSAQDQFALHPELFSDNWKIWQVLTYGFLHAGLTEPSGAMHILLNMYGLFLFGRDVELRYGRQEMLRFYLLAIVVSGAGWLLVGIVTDHTVPVVGASGGVIAVLVLYCFNFPQRRLLLMGIVPVPAWGLGLGIVVIDLMRAMGHLGFGRGPSEVAYEAHLAGAAFALVYFKCGWSLGKIPSLNPGKWLKRQPRLKLHQPAADQKKDQAADKILEKIRQQGEASLSKKERRILDDYSRRMREKHHNEDPFR